MKKAWFTIIQIQPNVFALAEFMHWEKVVSYLLLDTTKAFLIDTGMGYESTEKIVRQITHLPIEVLLTHSHWDHIGGIDKFSAISIFNDEFEKKNLKQGFSSQSIKELNDPILFEKPFLPKKFIVKGKTKFHLLYDGEMVRSDTFTIKIIHTPGHTPGSVCFYIPERKLLCTGDTLYPGPLYVQLSESNVSDYVTSVKKLQKIIPKMSTILPGHNASLCDFNLMKEAGDLFFSLKKLNKNSYPNVIKSQSLSILLPTI